MAGSFLLNGLNYARHQPQRCREILLASNLFSKSSNGFMIPARLYTASPPGRISKVQRTAAFLRVEGSAGQTATGGRLNLSKTSRSRVTNSVGVFATLNGVHEHQQGAPMVETVAARHVIANAEHGIVILMNVPLGLPLFQEQCT